MAGDITPATQSYFAETPLTPAAHPLDLVSHQDNSGTHSALWSIPSDSYAASASIHVCFISHKPDSNYSKQDCGCYIYPFISSLLAEVRQGAYADSHPPPCGEKNKPYPATNSFHGLVQRYTSRWLSQPRSCIPSTRLPMFRSLCPPLSC